MRAHCRMVKYWMITITKMVMTIMMRVMTIMITVITRVKKLDKAMRVFNC